MNTTVLRACAQIFSNSAKIYAIPETVRVGEKIDARQVVAALKRAGYAEKESESQMGTYRVEGSTITTKVEVAWNESWVGGEQVRHIRFEGDKLFIESPPMPHPNMYGKTVRVIVVWQRDGSFRVGT